MQHLPSPSLWQFFFGLLYDRAICGALMTRDGEDQSRAHAELIRATDTWFQADDKDSLDATLVNT
jgi:hypothetical protein